MDGPDPTSPAGRRCTDAERRLAAIGSQIVEVKARRAAYQAERDDLVRAEVASGRTRTAVATDASIYRANAGFIVAKQPPSATALAMDPSARQARLIEIGDLMAALESRMTRLIEQRDPLIAELASRCRWRITAIAKIAGCTKQNVSLILGPVGRGTRRGVRRAPRRTARSV